MTSVLTAFRDNAEKVAAAVAECRRLGIAVLPPDVHASHLEFTVEGEAIRFGLLAVKNVGQGAIESIIAAREEGGPFRSFADFCNRIDLRLVNKRVLESLVKVGALNALRAPGPAAAGPRRRPRRRPGGPARAGLGPDQLLRPRGRAGRARGAAARRRRRSPSASGSAGRRSCWGSTSPTTRSARSRSGSGGS